PALREGRAVIHQLAAMTEQGLATRIGKYRAREQSRDSAHEIAAMTAQAVAGSREAWLSRQGFTARIQCIEHRSELFIHARNLDQSARHPAEVHIVGKVDGARGCR